MKASQMPCKNGMTLTLIVNRGFCQSFQTLTGAPGLGQHLSSKIVHSLLSFCPAVAQMQQCAPAPEWKGDCQVESQCEWTKRSNQLQVCNTVCASRKSKSDCSSASASTTYSCISSKSCNFCVCNKCSVKSIFHLLNPFKFYIMSVSKKQRGSRQCGR